MVDPVMVEYERRMAILKGYEAMPEPTEQQIADGAHILSEIIDDAAPLNERYYRFPAIAMLKYAAYLAASATLAPVQPTETWPVQPTTLNQKALEVARKAYARRWMPSDSSVFSSQAAAQVDYIIQSYIEALPATAAPVQPEGWLDIASAPKDGTTILAWSDYNLEPATVHWNEHRKCWRAVWEQNEVIENETDFGTSYKEADPLTHWQPLPSPPTSTGGTAK